MKHVVLALSVFVSIAAGRVALAQESAAFPRLSGPPEYSDDLRGVSARDVNPSTGPFCLGQYIKTDIADMRNIHLVFEGESLRRRAGNVLVVSDGNGQFIEHATEDSIQAGAPTAAVLPYNPGTLKIRLIARGTISDICLSGNLANRNEDNAASFDDISIRFDKRGGPPGPGPGPGPRPPPPPPPPAPVFYGTLGLVDVSRGQVFGSICRYGDSDPVDVNLYIGGDRVGSTVTGRAIGWIPNSSFGRPNPNCNVSFSFELSFDPRPHLGDRKTVEVRGFSRRLGQDFPVNGDTSRRVLFSRPVTGNGIFKLAGPEYFYALTLGEYCQVAGEDQLRAARRSRGKPWSVEFGEQEELPPQMKRRDSFKGPCPVIPYPFGTFRTREAPTNRIFLSYGDTNQFCHIPTEEMLNRIGSKYRQPTHRDDVPEYDRIPRQMSNGTVPVCSNE